MRFTLTNPPKWAQEAITKHWDMLRRRHGSKWMPMREKGTHRTVELGCGHYGCVWQTRDPNVVLKITRDISEVEFIDHYFELDNKPDGIIPYYDIINLKGHGMYGWQLYAIWRAASKEVGFWWSDFTDPYFRRAAKESTAILDAFLFFAALTRRLAVRYSAVDIPRAYEDLDRWWGTGLEVANCYIEREPFASYLHYPQDRASICISACMHLALMLEHNAPVLTHVGHALGYYLSHGILLADVHVNNIGKYQPEDFTSPIWVITDPGHAVFLL